jgi:hypothetical protein
MATNVKELHNELLETLGKAAELAVAMADAAYQDSRLGDSDAVDFYNGLEEMIRNKQAMSKMITDRNPA